MPLNHDQGPTRRFFYGWYIVFTLWAMLFLASAVSVGLFFKPILNEFKVDRATLSLIYTGASLLFAVVTPFTGLFIDRFGARVMFFVCVATQTLSSIANGLATSLAFIFTGRFLYDIKALQAGQVLINRWFVKNRGLAQGIAAMGMPLGALLLVPLSQLLISSWGWRQTMFFWAGLTLVVVAPLTLLVRNLPEEKGYYPEAEPGGQDMAGDWSLKSAEERHGGGAAIFSGHGLAQAARLPSFWLLLTTQLCCGIGCGFMMTHIVIFATDVGFSDLVGATLLSVQGGVAIIGLLVTGHISDRFARHRVLGLTHTIRGISLVIIVVFIFLGGGRLWMLYMAMALFGFGWIATSPLTSGLVADLFGGMRMGTIIGVTMSCHTIGMALGAYGGGITFDLTGSYFRFFLAQSGLELLAAGCAFAIKREEKASKLYQETVANS